ncbi:zinc finger CCHC domain-containing protein 7 isoform X1 [Oncorhynchus tshawytscha]|nr:zinc finger CCHC domain-containing protein 7 isoform X1 [Oncorhynchus tshawytscha]XP_024285114.1 zinc finger CCHC domain-containing protein 7 isoform X1 [Oncorhynchus tshawytscha]
MMMGHQNDEEEGGNKDNRFYIEASSSSEGELGFSQYKQSSSPRAPQATGGNSPLVLAFPLSSGRALRDVSPLDSSPSPNSRLSLHSEQDLVLEYDDEALEEWMILGAEEQEGDEDIQLNLGYWSSSSESHSGTEDEELNAKYALKHNWAIIEKDKPRPYRYFTSDRNLTCHNCNKTGHLAKGCTTPRRRPTCVLCGLQGHVQRACPGRHCHSCGLPSHGYQPCPEPPFWNQHCHRCGMAGHLSDACPDTWRQFHFTTQQEVPLRPHVDHTHKHCRHNAHCYNCSRRGHLGHECTQRRMISGTFASLPYVCHYDNKQDIVKLNTRIHRKARELRVEGFMPLLEHQRTYVTPGGSSEEERPSPAPGRRRSLEGRRKTWPERRRERREVKKLRREAQARRAVGMTKWGSDEVVYTRDHFKNPHREPIPPPQKKRRREESRESKSEERSRKGRSKESSRKNREAERWKKRGGLKRGYLYPRDDLGPMNDYLLSPKNRVRIL